MPYTPANGQNFPGQQWAFAGMTTMGYSAVRKPNAPLYSPG
jgi:hypothetical protein